MEENTNASLYTPLASVSEGIQRPAVETPGRNTSRCTRKKIMGLLTAGILIAGGATAAIILLHKGSNPSNTPSGPPPSGHPEREREARRFIGGKCHAIDGSECNPLQLPGFSKSMYTPPTPVLNASHVYISDGRGVEEGHLGTLSFSSSQVSFSTASSFGLDAGFSWADGLFSASAGYQSVVDNMFFSSTESLHYYGKASARVSLWEASIHPTSELSLTPEVSNALKALPGSLGTSAERAAYFDFFSKYGTHYVSYIEFGGIMEQTIYLDISVTEKLSGSSSHIQDVFHASFADFINLPGYQHDVRQEDLEAFRSSEWSSGSTFRAVGGDPTVGHDFSSWEKTVASNPVPIRTQLKPLWGIVDGMESQLLEGAFTEYLKQCPHNNNNEICSGHGKCNWDSHTCTCQPGYYGDMCEHSYKKCSHGCVFGKCNEKTGLCECQPNYGGCACNIACGESTIYNPRIRGYSLDYCGDHNNCGDYSTSHCDCACNSPELTPGLPFLPSSTKYCVEYRKSDSQVDETAYCNRDVGNCKRFLWAGCNAVDHITCGVDCTIPTPEMCL